MEEKKKKQHYVFQAYLKKWCDKNGELYYYRKSLDRFYKRGPSAIMYGQQMYRIQELNEDEKKFFEFFMTMMHLSDDDRREMRGHINTYLTPFNNERAVDLLQKTFSERGSSQMNNELKQHIDELYDLIDIQMINTEEDFYGEYETESKTWITELISGNTSFYYSDRSEFIEFICIQYFRTYGMRGLIAGNIRSILKEYIKDRDEFSSQEIIEFEPDNVDPEHILPHAVWLIQAKCSDGLASSDIQIVRNRTGLPFITTDQPVINMKAEVNGKAPDEFVLWYPISPSVGVIINSRSKEERILEKRLDVDKLNRMMWEHSFEYVVSDKEEVLKGMIELDW